MDPRSSGVELAVRLVSRDVRVLGRPWLQDVVSSHNIGRDSWVWGEQEALEMISSPHEVGEVAITERSPCREETG